MKKNLFIILSLFAISLAGCTTSDKQVTKIDSQEGEQLFNSQVENFQYINDLEDFLSYNVLSLTENKPFTSDFSISAKFDENSSLEGGIDFSQKKYSKSYDNEKREMEFSVIANGSGDSSEPFEMSGNISLLYQNDEMYANLHKLNVFMGEGNMVAKMYTLLGDLIIDNRVNLEIHSGGIISVDEDGNKKLPYIIGTFKNVLKTENIKSSPDFLNSVAELIDTINSYIDLGISTNELTIISHDTSYSELGNKNIQKNFTGVFQGKESAFDLSFSASKDGLNVRLYNIREFDKDMQDYKNIDSELLFSIEENGKSEYSTNFQLLESQQKIADIQGEIKYANNVKISADFVLEPLELIAGEKISGKLEGEVTKKSGEINEEIPELTGNILSLSELLSSL